MSIFNKKLLFGCLVLLIISNSVFASLSSSLIFTALDFKKFKKEVEKPAIAPGTLHNLGYCYNNGMGTDENTQQACKYYKIAADKGFAASQFSLGLLYEKGERGIEKNIPEAIKLYEAAALQNYAPAQNNLGRLMQDGIGGIKANPTKAFMHYSASAAQHHGPAQNNLGYCYQYGIGTPPNPDKAFVYYKLAAKQKVINAYYNLGVCHQEGIGTQIDYKAAFGNYKMAAIKGHASAQNMVGYYYEYGMGTDMNFEEALKWYKLSADNNNIEAQKKLCFCYLNGFRVSKCLALAIIYLESACQQGDENSKLSLNILKAIDKYTPGLLKKYENDDKPSIKDLQDPEIQYLIGLKYFYGDDYTDKDSDEATKHFELAAEQQHAKAIYILKYGCEISE